MSLVIDASFTLKLLLPNPEQVHCRELMAGWAQNEGGLYAPTLWLYEVVSALTKAVYFELLTETEGQQALQLAQTLGIQLVHLDDNQVRMAYEWTRRLNRAAAYDSYYLALTESLSAALWTADKRLVNAVEVPWLHYLIDDVSI